MKKALAVLFGFLLAAVFSGCSNQERETAAPLKELRISILPDESEAQLKKRYTPLFEFLSRETGLPYRLVIPKNYTELVDLFAANQIDLAYFGGFTFVRANVAHGAIPLVMRDVDTRFTTLFLTRADSPNPDCRDFQGERFAFGSRLSTSGHLMPRFYMGKEKEIVPETFFSSVRYSGKHDLTAYWVRDGVVDLGAANAAIIGKMFRDGRLKEDEVRIVWETPPYPDYVWAVRAGVGEADRHQLQRAFLALSSDNAAHAEILSGVDAGGFFPAQAEDFASLKTIAKTLSLLP